MVSDYGIRTVINLRGVTDDEEWYHAEVKAAKELGVKLVDVGMWSNSPPPKGEFRILIRSLAEDEGPFFVHCFPAATAPVWVRPCICCCVLRPRCPKHAVSCLFIMAISPAAGPAARMKSSIAMNSGCVVLGCPILRSYSGTGDLRCTTAGSSSCRAGKKTFYLGDPRLSVIDATARRISIQ